MKMKTGKSKRLIAGFICLLMFLSMTLIGCNNNNNNNEESSQTASSQSQSESDTPLEAVNLTWYVIGSEQADQDTVMVEINKYLKEKINATLDLEILDWGSYDQSMQVKISAGEKFDMCFTTRDWVTRYYPNVARGAFLPLDDMLDQYASEFRSLIPEKYWDATRVDGKIFGSLNYQVFATTPGFYALKDLVEKYDFDYENVKSYRDLEPFMKNILENESGVYPVDIHKVYMLPLTTLENDYFIDRMNVRSNDTDMKVFDFYESPEFESYIKLMRDWYLKGYIREDAASITSTTEDISVGRYALMIRHGKPGGEVEMMAQTGGREVVHIPIGQTVVEAGGVLATMTAISQTSDNPERSMMLLNLVNTDKKLFNMLNFGLEGTHYTKIDDDTIEIIENSGYFPNTAWQFGNQFNAYYIKGQEKGIWEETIALNESALRAPTLGFNFDQEPISHLIAQQASIVEEYVPALTTGSLDPDTYLPEFIDKLGKADSEREIMAEIQRQLDEWKNK